MDRDYAVHHALVTKRGALGVDRKEVGRRAKPSAVSSLVCRNSSYPPCATRRALAIKGGRGRAAARDRSGPWREAFRVAGTRRLATGRRHSRGYTGLRGASRGGRALCRRTADSSQQDGVHPWTGSIHLRRGFRESFRLGTGRCVVLSGPWGRMLESAGQGIIQGFVPLKCYRPFYTPIHSQLLVRWIFEYKPVGVNALTAALNTSESAASPEE